MDIDPSSVLDSAGIVISMLLGQIPKADSFVLDAMHINLNKTLSFPVAI